LGELFVDFALAQAGGESSLRLGGIAHAARGLSALGVPFAVAAVCPGYLRETAEAYLRQLGCTKFIRLGKVTGAPNVIVIRDVTEIGDQGYEDLLRSSKRVHICDVRHELQEFAAVLVFPGAFDLAQVCSMLPPDCKLHIDVAYDVESVDELAGFGHQVDTVLISTSSNLFRRLADSTGLTRLWEAFKRLDPSSVVLKENRGGARVLITAENRIEPIPALIGTTVNSVGVGDVFSGTYVALKEAEGPATAAWRAAQTSSAYAQTNSLKLFITYVQRSLQLSHAQMVELGGVHLPWERRQALPIYLAAPDFSHGDRKAINEALRSLEYHNFRVRRPVTENGELPPDSSVGRLLETYCKDLETLGETVLVFAVPTGRDPGTLVEMGIAIERRMPVIVYDPPAECKNTMVIAGAKCYSQSLDECLNAVFRELAVISEERP
jgi:nucleoside 2-deoxyribosyltransferase